MMSFFRVNDSPPKQSLALLPNLALDYNSAQRTLKAGKDPSAFGFFWKQVSKSFPKPDMYSNILSFFLVGLGGLVIVVELVKVLPLI